MGASAGQVAVPPADLRMWSFGDDAYVAVIEAHWPRRWLWRRVLRMGGAQCFTDRGRVVAFRGTRPTNLPEVQRQNADVVVRQSRPGIYLESRLLTFDPAGSASVAVDSLCPNLDDEVACVGPTGPTKAEDCIPTTGDNCDCEPKCTTQDELDEAQKDGVCDLGCMFGDGSSLEPNWTCTVVDGACAVVEPSDGPRGSLEYAREEVWRTSPCWRDVPSCG